ncbi:LacI family DNA-binding transcriptional regulator [Ruania alba]|uniref:DNA-binding transcriptional regulator, LacI/PurR family n=1 Tax=Ruania alba TaxID=648782 RepID=A0A1H5D5D9_9MICO|nr:LacI family DNA-binding transcriptional regulator [Ruania alba]SED74024.1 DNA-binding transcriptional regulator, LacI/PurR family [Ruania alba]
MSRPTIRTVAAAAGVSAAAVSHAMNGKPNIPPATAQRIRAIADELGWRPASAGRRLSGVVSDVGLIVSRSQEDFERDATFVHILASISIEISKRGLTLVLAFVEEPDAVLEVYRRWWQEQKVNGFLLLDPVVDDPRAELLAELGVPAVTIGHSPAPEKIPEVTVADEHTMTDLMEHVRGLGHDRMARLSDPDTTVAVARRNDLYCVSHRDAFGEDGILVVSDPHGPVATDLEQIVSETGTSIAVLVDSELMASRLYTAAHEHGWTIPGDVSVISWEDSWVCEMLVPRLTALRPPIKESARVALDLLAAQLRSEGPKSGRVGPRELIERDSVADRRA